MTDQPTAAELKEFIEVFDRLCRFEAGQRLIRRIGAGIKPLPHPAVQKTVAWLAALSAGERK